MTAAKGLPHPKDVAIGNRISLVRQQQSQSQERLGQEIGVSFQQIQKYEQGLNRISYSRLTEIATALDMSVTELIAPLDDKHHHGTRTPDYAQMLQQPGALEMLTAFCRLPAQKQRKAGIAFMTLISDED